MPPGHLPGEVFRACPTGKRPRGRPRTRWRDYVFRLAWERLGVPPEELEEVAREREPLSPMEHNGPGLEYKVSYRRQDVEEEWQEQIVKRHSFVVKNTPTFVPYEIQIQAKNHAGWAPEPETIVAYSGEDFPDQPALFRATDVQKHALTLSWSPPVEANGVLTSCVLQYQLINNTEEVGPFLTVNITNPDTNKWHLRDLEPVSRYRFYLYYCTQMGCGPPASEEYITIPEAHLASIHSGISNQGWFIGLMCAVALLTLIVLIACFVNRNKGGKYSVKEKEDLHPDLESQGINDDTFCEYSDNDEKPLKGSQHSLSGDLKRGDSGDSIVDYGDEDAQFNEDGSFIGEYAGQKERASMEIKGTFQSKA
ncbi:hypothetical protein QTP70_007085 [Hemibagrus guttatus]|uniref:Fibronectin type-III domain-containing protein n=1 Tax=Hemibagrus guttatus TaxID=175788 RepID=A0AAE0RKL1_9TELE|nr:hypothetical protein QTP70_007085 [Hemibagrus guttatus]